MLGLTWQGKKSLTHTWFRELYILYSLVSSTVFWMWSLLLAMEDLLQNPQCDGQLAVKPLCLVLHHTALQAAWWRSCPWTSHFLRMIISHSTVSDDHPEQQFPTLVWQSSACMSYIWVYLSSPLCYSLPAAAVVKVRQQHSVMELYHHPVPCCGPAAGCDTRWFSSK